ncbi:PIPO, partial [Cucurbit vein banding virus]
EKIRRNVVKFLPRIEFLWKVTICHGACKIFQICDKICWTERSGRHDKVMQALLRFCGLS